MAKLDFQINKPTDVSEENLSDVVNDIYDAVNRLASATNKFVAKHLPSEGAPPNPDTKFKIVDDQNDDTVRIAVNIDGEWYSTDNLTKEE